jgi:hypothetical protein
MKMSDNHNQPNNGPAQSNSSDTQQRTLSAKEALLVRLRELKPEDFEAWKEEIRQSRLHDWDDDDEVDPLAEKFDGQKDDGTNEV